MDKRFLDLKHSEVFAVVCNTAGRARAVWEESNPANPPPANVVEDVIRRNMEQGAMEARMAINGMAAKLADAVPQGRA